MGKNYQTGCRYFSGYKPCGKSLTCDDLCPARDIPKNKILLIHLGAIGAVLRSTSLLRSIKKKYPSSHITWVTQKPCDSLLKNHPLIDKVLTTSSEDQLVLKNFRYDVAICVDKSLIATGLLQTVKVEKVYGFMADTNGAIIPANFAAKELWGLGLDNHKKFFVNQKSEVELMHQAFELPYQRSEYFLPLNDEEEKIKKKRREAWTQTGHEIFVGINTGCSNAIPYKKLSFDGYVELIERIQQQKGLIPVLLGGPEDQERNEKLHIQTGAVYTSCNKGLRDGLVSVAACDIVFTGDSLGMHMAISQKKWVVAWFGPTCAHEIDLYERGVKVLSQVSCGPCWKRRCSNSLMCYDLVPLDEVLKAILQGCDFVLNKQKDPAINL